MLVGGVCNNCSYAPCTKKGFWKVDINKEIEDCNMYRGNLGDTEIEYIYKDKKDVVIEQQEKGKEFLNKLLSNHYGFKEELSIEFSKDLGELLSTNSNLLNAIWRVL